MVQQVATAALVFAVPPTPTNFGAGVAAANREADRAAVRRRAESAALAPGRISK